MTFLELLTHNIQEIVENNRINTARKIACIYYKIMEKSIIYENETEQYNISVNLACNIIQIIQKYTNINIDNLPSSIHICVPWYDDMVKAENEIYAEIREMFSL